MTENSARNGSVFRVHKNQGFTCMSNHHLKNKTLSLKAKGLLSIIFSLPDNWNYSINGLAAISSDGRDSILSAIKALQEAGYIRLEKVRNEKGQFDTIYNIYEEPQLEENLTESDFPSRLNRIGFTESANPQQLNTNKLNTKINKKNKEADKKNEKKAYGEFQNVFLTDKHIEALKVLYCTEAKFNEAIGVLSTYKATKNKTYENDYAVLAKHNWVYKKVIPKEAEEKNGQVKIENKADNIPDYSSVSRW